jgi:hypothetical protein
MPSPLFRAAKLLTSPQGRKAMQRANEEVRKQLADPKNQERLAKAKEQVQKQLTDPKNKERLNNLKTKVQDTVQGAVSNKSGETGKK